MTLKTAVRDGVRLRYLDTGAGDPPLLFVHGWCCNHTFWEKQIDAFSSRHRVVAVDLRGHGESDKPEQDYTIAGFAEDVAWLCKEIGLERPIVVGHSMGGVIALNLVRKHPQLARAIVLVDSPIVPFPESVRPMLDAVLTGLKSAAYVDTATTFVATLMFREDSDLQLKQSIVNGMAMAPQQVMWSALASTASEQNILAGPLPVPALYVRASTQLATADQVCERYPGMAVQEFDAAHFLQMERPDQFNAMLRRFIEGLPQ